MTRVRLFTAFVIGLLLISGTALLAQEATGIPQITIERTAEAFNVPAELPEGAVTLSFVNNTEAPLMPVVGRLNEGVSFDALMASAAESPDAALAHLSLLGGTMVNPMSTLDVTYYLRPGEYALINFASEAPEAYPFTVTDAEGEGAAGPEAQIEVELLDFAFTFPLEVPAGEQTWSIINNGQQWHEMAIFRLPDDLTVAEYREMLNAMMFQGGPQGEDPAAEATEAPAEGSEGGPMGGPEPLFFFAPMNQGEQAWVNLNLEPGVYGVVCFLPDILESGYPHAHLGMTQIFTVTDAMQ